APGAAKPAPTVPKLTAISDFPLALLGAQRRNPIAYMLTTECHRVPAAQAGVEQDIAPDSLLTANRPPLIISGRILLGPNWEAGTLPALRALDADSRVDCNVLGFFRPLE